MKNGTTPDKDGNVTAKQASSTAVFTTMLRAIHQTADSDPKILVDPVSVALAQQFEGTPAWSAFRGMSESFLRMTRSALVLRNRFAEDVLGELAARSPCQYVILGAGFDTFGYRQPAWAEGVSIFEVDHPATQEIKLNVLAECGLTPPENLHMCGVDFEQMSLQEGLAQSGFNPEIPSVFSWLGVTQYLTEPAIRSTLEFVQSQAASSAVVFTFLPPDDELGEQDRGLLAEIDRIATTRGEPFVSRFSLPALASLLQDTGFQSVEHLSPEDAQRRYFGDRSDGLRVLHAEQLIRATV